MNEDKVFVKSPYTPDSASTDRLHELAEEILCKRSSLASERPESLTVEAGQRLLHNLQVHQVELELQNEELRRIQMELEASRARYFDLYDLAPVGYLTLSEGNLILEANLTVAEFLGVNRSKLLNQPFSKMIFPEDLDAFYRIHRRLAVSSEPQVIELRVLKHRKQFIWTRLEANRNKQPDGAYGLRVVLSDISTLKENEERLRQAAAMFECAREGVMVTDAAARILLVNRAFSELTGYSESEAIGQSARMLKSGRQAPSFYAAMWSEINASDHWQGEIWNRRKGGEVYPQLLSISAIRNQSGQVTHYVGVFSDISQIKDAAARLDFLAHHDPLTGLPNRLLLFARLQHCLDVARRDRKSLALLMLDLDRFKDVNDSFGHLAGDELLQQVALRLTQRLRGVDTVTRLGGDEFAVLLDNLAHPQDAAIVATEIINALSEPWRLSSRVEVRIGVSVGISLFPQNGKSAEELLKQADAALYRAKGEGRGNFKYFSDDLTHAALRRINLESLLRRGILREELQVYYQPQIDIPSGRIIGAEALIRWHQPVEGDIPPGQFIPVAEETGLIATLGKWVLSETCRQGQSWLEDGLPSLRLAVNVSPHQLRHGDLGATVAAVLSETGFPPDRLELELTESALMERESEAVEVLQQLRDLGVHLAIDDFGTGYSSLAYLKRFPLDALKIDKSFIEDIPEQQGDSEIAAAIVGLGHTLRLKVLAEGVETAEQLAFLKQEGCDYYQGYLSSPALPAKDFEAAIRRQM